MSPLDKTSVQSLILKWPLTPVGLLLSLVGEDLDHFIKHLTFMINGWWVNSLIILLIICFNLVFTLFKETIPTSGSILHLVRGSWSFPKQNKAIFIKSGDAKIWKTYLITSNKWVINDSVCKFCWKTGCKSDFVGYIYKYKQLYLLLSKIKNVLWHVLSWNA